MNKYIYYNTNTAKIQTQYILPDIIYTDIIQILKGRWRSW